MVDLVKQKPVFNLVELKGNRFYKITHNRNGFKSKVYKCILISKSEDELIFMYSWNFSIGEISTSELSIKINELDGYVIEVIE